MKILVEDYSMDFIGGGQCFAAYMVESLFNRGHQIDFLVRDTMYMRKQEIELTYGVDLGNEKNGVHMLNEIGYESRMDIDPNYYDLHINCEHANWIKPRADISVMFCHLPMNGNKAHERKYTKVLCPSEFSKDVIKEYWDIETEVIPLFIKPIKPLPKQRRIVAVSRLVPYKHPFEMLEEWRKCENGLWEFHLYGSTSHSNMEWVDKLEHAFNTTCGAFLHRDPSNFEIRTALAEASIFWHLGGINEWDSEPLKAEAWGMAVAEAMSAGCYCMIPENGGVAEVMPNISISTDMGQHLGEIGELRVSTKWHIKVAGLEYLKDCQSNIIQYVQDNYTAPAFWQRFNKIMGGIVEV